MAPWDGLETARQLRLLPDCPPIIFLGDVPDQRNPGAVPHLPKAFRTAQLIQLVEAKLQLSRAARSAPPTLQLHS